MFPHETRPRDFILPVLLILLGGAVSRFFESLIVPVLIWTVAMLMSLWLVISSVLDKWRAVIDSEDSYQRHLDRLTDEDKVERGMISVPESVRVERKLERPQQIQWKYDYLSISPLKLKNLAYACLAGTPFAERPLANKKILTSTEFRTLKNEMLECGFIVPRSREDARQGFEFTDSGWEVLRDVVGRGKDALDVVGQPQAED